MGLRVCGHIEVPSEIWCKILYKATDKLSDPEAIKKINSICRYFQDIVEELYSERCKKIGLFKDVPDRNWGIQLSPLFTLIKMIQDAHGSKIPFLENQKNEKLHNNNSSITTLSSPCQNAGLSAPAFPGTRLSEEYLLFSQQFQKIFKNDLEDYASHGSDPVIKYHKTIKLIFNGIENRFFNYLESKDANHSTFIKGQYVQLPDIKVLKYIFIRRYFIHETIERSVEFTFFPRKRTIHQVDSEEDIDLNDVISLTPSEKKGLIHYYIEEKCQPDEFAKWHNAAPPELKEISIRSLNLLIVRKNFAAFYEVLAKTGIDINDPDYGFLNQALETESLDAVKHMIENKGANPKILASYYAYDEEEQLFLDAPSQKMSILHLFWPLFNGGLFQEAEESSSEEDEDELEEEEFRFEGFLRYLLGLGVDINAPDSFGNTPLIYACAYGTVDHMETLIRFGADIHVRNTKNQSIIDWAINQIRERDFAKIIYLLNTHPDLLLNMSEQQGRLFCKHTISKSWVYSFDVTEDTEIEDREIIECLNYQLPSGNTIFSFVLERLKHKIEKKSWYRVDKLKKLIISLINKGAKIYIRNNAGELFFDLAIKNLKRIPPIHATRLLIELAHKTQQACPSFEITQHLIAKLFELSCEYSKLYDRDLYEHIYCAKAMTDLTINSCVHLFPPEIKLSLEQSKEERPLKRLISLWFHSINMEGAVSQSIMNTLCLCLKVKSTFIQNSVRAVFMSFKDHPDFQNFLTACRNAGISVVE